MPLDYNIPLLAQPFDAQGTFNNALMNGQSLNEVRNTPLRNQLLQQQVQQGAQGNYDAHMKSLYGAALAAKPYLDAGDVKGAMAFAQRHAQEMQAAGLPTSELDHFRQALQTDPNQAKQIVNDTITLGNNLFPDHPTQFGAQKTVQDEKGNTYLVTTANDPKTGAIKPVYAPLGNAPASPVGAVSIVGDYGLTAPQAIAFKTAAKGGETTADLTARRQLEPGITGANETAKNASDAAYAGITAQNAAQGKATVEAATAPGIEAAKTGANATETRLQEWVTAGANAADTTPVLRRSIELLKTVNTGGLSKVLYEVQHFAGIESADAGELSHMLAKNVLQQLKPTFGAQFTRAEGDKLDDIEARLGNSPPANERLLQQALALAEKSAKRAMDIAKSKGDLVTASAIKNSLAFTLNPMQQQPAQQVAQPQQPAQTQQPAQPKAPTVSNW